MVISKSVVLNRNAVRANKAVDQAQEIIDPKLAGLVKDGQHIMIPVSDFDFYRKEAEEFSKRVIQGIIDRYSKCGWTVTFTADQRDGAWLDFS